MPSWMSISGESERPNLGTRMTQGQTLGDVLMLSNVFTTKLGCLRLKQTCGIQPYSTNKNPDLTQKTLEDIRIFG